MIIDQAMKVMEAIAKEKIKINIMLWGTNGIGKTQVFKALSAKLGWEFWLQPVPSMDRTEIAGIPFKDTYKRKNGDEVLVQKMAYPEYVIKAMDGKIVIVFDEVNRAPKEIVNSLLEFVNERSINGKPLDDEIIIGLTGNPPDERNNVKNTDNAFNDRVVHVLVDTNTSATIEYFESLKDKPDAVHKDILNYLKKNKSKLLKHDDRDSEIPVKRYASPRNWKERVNRIWKELRPVSEKYGILPATIDELIIGTLGEEAGSFLQFVKSTEKPLTLDDVLNLSPENMEKISYFANLDSNGNEKNDGITELSFFNAACVEIENSKNSEIVEKNYDKILDFLSLIPISFAFRVISNLGKHNTKFWGSKLGEVKLNPITKKPLIDPVTNESTLRWKTLCENSMKLRKLQEKNTNDFIDSKKNTPI